MTIKLREVGEQWQKTTPVFGAIQTAWSIDDGCPANL